MQNYGQNGDEYTGSVHRNATQILSKVFNDEALRVKKPYKIHEIWPWGEHPGGVLGPVVLPISSPAFIIIYKNSVSVSGKLGVEFSFDGSEYFSNGALPPYPSKDYYLKKLLPISHIRFTHHGGSDPETFGCWVLEVEPEATF